ncbi:MAG: hypothetical protein Q7N87_01585 [Candidatus Uhrbacteria bacterium]|nr:hypothetical protein [Candidatus Uhrbacteria bacterium]MDP3793856.1 hypothetical protein [Candidatus Uhrbacteria bacterium]
MEMEFLRQIGWLCGIAGLVGMILVGHIPLLILWFIPERFFKITTSPQRDYDLGYREPWPPTKEPHVPWLRRVRDRLRSWRFTCRKVALVYYIFLSCSAVILVVAMIVRTYEHRRQLAFVSFYEVTARKWVCKTVVCENRGNGHCLNFLEETASGTDDRVDCPASDRLTNLKPGEMATRDSSCEIRFTLLSHNGENPPFKWMAGWIHPPWLHEDEFRVSAESFDLNFSPCEQELWPYKIEHVWEAKTERRGFVHLDTLRRVYPPLADPLPTPHP